MGNSRFFMLCFPQVLPLFLFVNTLLAFLIAYVWSVELKYVYEVFPYISDAGGKQPVSCVFGQLLNISAVIALMVMYLRYKIVAETDIVQATRVHCLNKWSLVAAFISVLGLSMVGNFQVVSDLVEVHLIGASMVFFVGTIYCILNCIISYILRRQGVASPLLCHTRLILTVATAFFLLMTVIMASVAHSEWTNGSDNSTEPRMTWQPDDPGFNSHVVSTFSEWLMGLMFLIFFLTFYDELSKISVNVKLQPKISSFITTQSDENDGGPIFA